MNKSLQRELEVLRTLSKYRLKRRLIIYRILYLLISDRFSFYISLISCLIPVMVFSSSVMIYFFVVCLHYFILWKYIKPKLDLFLKTENDREELEILINQIRRVFNNSTF